LAIVLDIVESGLEGSGSLTGVMSGRHYSRAMHCHKVMLEALERLLIEKYCFQKGGIKPLKNLFDAYAITNQTDDRWTFWHLKDLEISK